MKTSVLLTGAGMVGAQIVRTLIEDYDERPVVLDISFQREFLDSLLPPDAFIPVEGSVLDRQLVDELLKRHDIQRVVHTAAVLPMRVGHAAHPGFYQVNTWGTANVMFACAACGTRRFVMFSTNGVYQFRSHDVCAPVSEEYFSGLSDNNSYGNSKATAEFLLRELTEEGLLDGKILRPGEIYGPLHCRPGDAAVYWKRMIDAAIDGRPCVIENHPEHRLDWVYSTDVANLACLLLFADDTPHVAYHASYGKVMGIYDFVDALNEIFPGHAVQLRDCEKGGWKWPLSMDRAEADLGFKPTYDLYAGIRDYAAWYRQSKNRKGANEDR
jgi:nucleoside-diphosphate-sugar epimerase